MTTILSKKAAKRNRLFTTAIRTARKRSVAVMANDFSVLNPTIWANEAVVQLQPNMVAANLIARDFSDQVALFGDMVNAYVPPQFGLSWKGALCENVTVQDASGSRVQVALDQWPHIAFLICDGEEDRATLNLVDTLIPQAALAFAQGIDRIVGAMVYDFMDTFGGHLGHIDSTNVKDYVLETREAMNRNNVPLPGRTMILTPGTETEALKLDTIVTADKVGDGGQAIRDALLGRRYGFDFLMAQTQPEIQPTQVAVTAAVNSATGLPAGTTSIPFDGLTGGTFAVGQWITVSGGDTPQQITVVGGGTGGTPITIAPGLKRAVADNAVISSVKPGAVNFAAGYIGTTTTPRVIGYRKAIAVDGFANSPPQMGQGVTFGTTTDKYVIIGVTTLNAGAGTFEITLNKPLINAIADNATVNLLPPGKYNFAMSRGGYVLVNRPLAAPRAGTGAISRTVSDPISRISIRVTISYNPLMQGHLVVMDTLIGVGVLSKLLGAAMFG